MKRFTTTFIIFIILFTFVSMASAISVDGSKYTGNISAGSSDVHHLAVSTRSSDAPMSVTVTAYAFGQSRDMSYTMLSYDNKYSSSKLITIDKPSFILEPGKKVAVNATISIPSNVGAGGRYAIIYVKASPINSTSTYATAVTIPVLVTIDKSVITESADILGISIDGNVVSTRIKNNGNIHFYGLNNDVKLFDKSNGTFITGLRSKPSVYTFLPESEAVINITLDRYISINKYNVVSTVYKDDKQLAEQVMKQPITTSTTTATPLSAILFVVSLLAALAIAVFYQKDN
jgi:hypothetical protein